jgi:hypothetical protein
VGGQQEKILALNRAVLESKATEVQASQGNRIREPWPFEGPFSRAELGTE